MRSVCGDTLPCPAIAMPGHQAVAVENTGDQHQLRDGCDDITRGAVALSTPALRQAQFGMGAANPVDQQRDLGGFIVDIGDHLLNDSAHDAFLEPGVRCWRRPDSLKVCRQRRDARCQHR